MWEDAIQSVRCARPAFFLCMYMREDYCRSVRKEGGAEKVEEAEAEEKSGSIPGRGNIVAEDRYYTRGQGETSYTSSKPHASKTRGLSQRTTAWPADIGAADNALDGASNEASQSTSKHSSTRSSSALPRNLWLSKLVHRELCLADCHVGCFCRLMRAK